ncbi:MAG: helix-turn-helix domain-containing protein [Sedimentitalea sp.]
MRPVSTLLRPGAALGGCLLAGIFRDTRGANLSEADRVNHFPASPMVSVTLTLAGTLRALPTPTDWHAVKAAPQLARLSVMGPQNTPISSWSDGDMAALTVGMYFDAWVQLGGDAAYDHVPDPIAQAFAAFEAAPDSDAGWRAFCAQIATVWAPHRRSPAASVQDWARKMAAGAALSGTGRSLRAFERRLKRLSGQSKRTLDFYGAFENLHRVSRENAQTPLAAIAHEAGFADQSHMGRMVRRATGFSPAQLNRAIDTQEPFWCYRLLGERF